MSIKSQSMAALLMAGATGVASGAVFYDFESGAQGWTVGGETTTAIGREASDPTWFLGTALPGSVGQALPSTWWINPNIGTLGAERSYVMSPALVADATGISINFDSYSSNEGGYPNTYDVEHVQISINGSDFEDVHALTDQLHQGSDQTFRNITFATTGLAVGDSIQYRFLYDTSDSCRGPDDIQGWAFDNVMISAAADVPEPASLVLISLGLAGFGLRRMRGRKD